MPGRFAAQAGAVVTFGRKSRPRTVAFATIGSKREKVVGTPSISRNSGRWPSGTWAIVR
jgi:hypothetical protein